MEVERVPRGPKEASGGSQAQQSLGREAGVDEARKGGGRWHPGVEEAEVNARRQGKAWGVLGSKLVFLEREHEGGRA